MGLFATKDFKPLAKNGFLVEKENFDQPLLGRENLEVAKLVILLNQEIFDNGKLSQFLETLELLIHF